MEDGAQGRAKDEFKANGGYGGGTTGGAGTYNNGSTITTYTGKGGTPTAGGAAGTYTDYPATAGSFGQGGTAGRYTSTTYKGSGGGGRRLVWRSVVGAYRYAGGGGGSGFVWTSSTSSNVPSGYSVSSSYYLTDAATYAGNTSFASTSGSTETGHSGNGYARITLISGTIETVTEVTKTGNRWNNIEEQITSGTLTGSFNYNGKTITEMDTTSTVIVHNGE